MHSTRYTMLLFRGLAESKNSREGCDSVTDQAWSMTNESNEMPFEATEATLLYSIFAEIFVLIDSSLF